MKIEMGRSFGWKFSPADFLFSIQKILMPYGFWKWTPTLKSVLDFGLTPRLTTFAWI